MKPSKKSKPSASRVVSAKIKRAPVDDEVDEFEDEAADEDERLAGGENEADEVEEETEEEDRPRRAGGKSGRVEVKGEAKGFLDTIGDTLRSAGETAERYTRIGVGHAEIEKLRFDLKSAHAALGEVVMRCWHDAPDLGLTSRDPAIIQSYRRVKEVRRKIREKEAKIAELKRAK